jgi:DNA repair exonuclease SbcCD ATPase subunit
VKEVKMSEPTISDAGDVSPEAPATTEDTAVAPEGSAEIKTNPAWQPVLDVLPTSLHEIVAPTLKEWDRGVNEKFREIHSQYEPLKQYQQFADNGMSIEDLQGAAQLMARLTDDPRAVYDAMTEYYKFGTGPVADAIEADAEIDPYADPNAAKVTELEQQIQQMREQLEGRAQQETMQKEEQELEESLAALEKSKGAFDREFVLTQMAAGATADQAVDSYISLVEKIKTEARKPAATVIGGGNGAVAAPPDTKSMKPEDRRKYIASVLGSNKG